MSQPSSAPGTLHLDFETRSTVPFGRSKGAVTAYQYAHHPETEVLCMSYAFGDGPVYRWDPFLTDEPFPDAVVRAIDAGWILAGHNVSFEWCIWNFLLVPRLGLPELPIEQTDDTAARAAIMALPRSLEEACKAMRLPIQKDKEGSRLMRQMAKPRKARKTEDPDAGPYWFEDEERLLRLGRYCDQDVEAERALDKVLVPMGALNRRDFLLVHTANMRGVEVDVALAQRAQGVMDVVERRYGDELSGLTGFRVTSPTEIAGTKQWMEEVHGVTVDSLDKPSVIRLLDEHPDPESAINRVLHIRQEAGKSSVAKLQRFLELAHHDGRMRENFMFHGASTGRLSGKGAQMQNLPSRGGLPWQQAERVIDILMTYPPEAAADTIELLFGHVPEALSSCLRAHLKARRDRALYVADFSNIEGRVAAWFGDEHWKMQAFRDYDTLMLDGNGDRIPDGNDFLRKGPDLYKVTAAQILGLTPEQVDKVQRNILGKVPELALGFGGGVGAFVSMGKNFGVQMADYWPIIQAALGDEVIQAAGEHWDLFGSRAGSQIEEWLASEAVKIAWRARHPGIVRCWRDAEDCAIKALEHPGKWFPFAHGKLAFGAKRIGGVNFLIQRMPNGRRIYKAHAKLTSVKKFGRERFEVHYWGVDSITRQFVPVSTYGGDLFQSCVQGTAYDLMMAGWENVERDDFEVILSVHDELVAESHPDRSVANFEALMAELPGWAAGCPVAAAGYAADRYRKDG